MDAIISDRSNEARLEAENQLLRTLLRKVLGKNNCMCEHGIGNPMVNDHGRLCKELRKVVNDG